LAERVRPAAGLAKNEVKNGAANGAATGAVAAKIAHASPAREAAFAILLRVGGSSAHSDDLLHGPGMSGLSQADRNLATALVLGVLRWQIALDATLRPLLQRPDVELAAQVAIALRLGAFQLLHMDRIPAHAALSESVELARTAGHGHAAGMVNAVLRKLTRREPVKAKLYEPIAAVAERLGHPGWLVERWAREYGRAAAVAVCEYDQREPAQGGLFADAEAAAAVEVKMAEGAGAPLVAMAPLGAGAPLMALAPLVKMDDGSRLVAELAAASRPGARRIWDCCAAPGGKTIVLARRHPEAELLATDVSSRRTRALAERLRKGAESGDSGAMARVRVVEADATKLPEGEGEFDLVLCDVPCSGTGTLARNPEIKQRLQPTELARQAGRQREILAAALERVAPGGRLVYSTCSLEPEENERVVEAVLGNLAGAVRRVPVDGVLEELRERGVLNAEVSLAGCVRDGFLRTLPGAGFQGDGFFAAVLARD
jgi:16S rRNA (cytosine967-C5)-methyltransferase